MLDKEGSCFGNMRYGATVLVCVEQGPVCSWYGVVAYQTVHRLSWKCAMELCTDGSCQPCLNARHWL